MKRYKGIKIALIALVAVLVTTLIGGWVMFGTQLTAANTIEKLDDGLWCMEYKGDYGFDGFLAQGGAKSDAEMGDYIASFLSHGFLKPDTSIAGGDYGCSVLMTQTPEGGMVFGRNYDWSECKAMVIHTVPKDGYESISTCCLDFLGFLGFGEDWMPDKDMGSKFMALAAVYVPLDGMNEKGLCVADLVVEPGEVIHQDTEKPDLTTTSALRLLLDKAATVDEAVELLGQYDMNFSIDSAHHFALSDAAGKSVVVEWMGDEMIVTETNVVTNHYLAGDAEPDLEEIPKEYQPSYIRYWALCGRNLIAEGKMTAAEVLEGKKTVVSSTFNEFRADGETRRTQWTLVFDQQALTAELYRCEEWEKPYRLAMGGKAWLEK